MDLITDYRRKIIANSPHLSSASGAIASFSDGADLPLNSLIVDIEPVQSGSGDPSPTNIRPISGWSAVKVTRDGKNLLDPSKRVAYSSGKGQRWHEADGYTLKANNTYTFSVIFQNPISLHIRAKADGISLANGNNSVTYTPTENIDVYFQAYRAENISGVDTFQLELGSTATQYEPYNGETVTVQLGETVYGGTLNPLTGVLTVDRAAVDLGSLTWSKSSSGTGRFYTSNGAIPQYGFGRIYSLCSRYTDGGYANGSDYYGSDGQIRYWYRGQSATPRELYVVDTSLASATAAEFKSAMSGVLWVCELATPYTVQLTPHQIRSLYGNNTIFADTGNIALEYWAHP